MKFLHIEKVTGSLFYDFILVDTPLPFDYCPAVEETDPFLFARIPDDIIEEIWKAFDLASEPEHWDPWGLNYYSKDKLKELNENIEKMIRKVGSLTKEQFLSKFQPWIFFHYLPKHEVPTHWKELQDDLVETLELIREKSTEAFNSGKYLVMIGI